MTPAEIAAQLLAKSREENHSNTDADKTDYYRRKKAEDFVQGYITVLNMKKDLIDQGLDPQEFTATRAVTELIALWEHKAVDKATTAI